MDLSKYPRVESFLKEHPDMDLDKALSYVENEILKQECSVNDKRRNNSQ